MRDVQIARHAKATGRNSPSPYLYTPILHHQRSALGGGGQSDLFTLQPTNQNSPPYRSLQYYPIRTLAPLRNPTPPYVPPQMGIGKMARPKSSSSRGKSSSSIAPRTYRTPNLAAPLYLAPPHGSHTVRNREVKEEAEAGTQTQHTTHSSAFLHDKAEVRQDKDSGCSPVLRQIHLQRLSFKPQRE